MCGCERGQGLWGGCRKAEHVNAHMFVPERGKEGHAVDKQASICMYTVTEFLRGEELSYGDTLQEQKSKHLISPSFALLCAEAHGRSPASHCPCKVCYRTVSFSPDTLKWALTMVKNCLSWAVISLHPSRWHIPHATFRIFMVLTARLCPHLYLFAIWIPGFRKKWASRNHSKLLFWAPIYLC